MRIAFALALIGCSSKTQHHDEPATPVAPAPSSPTVIADVPDQTPFALAVVADRVYWTDRIGGAVWRVAIGGGRPEQIARGLDEPRWIVSWGGDLVVGTDGGVIAVPPTGGATRVLAPNKRAELATVRDRLYLRDADGVVAQLTASGATPLRGLPEIGAIAGAGDDLIAAALDRSLWRIAGTAAPVKFATLRADPIALAIHGTNVYAIPFGASEVESVPLSGGEPHVVARATKPIESFAVDDDGVWMTSIEGGTVSSAQGVIARDQSRPIALMADRTALYWITWQLRGGKGRIVRAAKPH